MVNIKRQGYSKAPVLYSINRLLVIVVVAVLNSSPALAWKGEANAFTTHDTFNNKAYQSVGFQQAFTSIPVVVVLPTTQGGDSATIRLRNVTTAGFENSPVEIFDRDGPHVRMNSAYIAVEPGIHTLPDGNVIVAGFVDTNRVQHGTGVAGATSWETVDFGYTFSSPPSIIAAIQTMNNEQGEGGQLPPYVSSVPWMTVAMDNITGSQFNIALERSEEAHGSIIQNERIGYIAMLNGANGTFTDGQNNTIQYLAETTPASVRGWDNGNSNYNYSIPFSVAPISVATKNTRNNPDGGWLRRNGNTTSTRIQLRVDEDTDRDNERGLSAAQAEAAGILSFSRNFIADFPPGFSVQKSSMVIADPVNGTVNPKAIPGAVVEYTLTITNTGHDFSDTSNFQISDALPANTSLLVSDIAGAGSGPVDFTDGVSSSLASWVFGGLSDLADSLAFSADGSDFNYAPTPDGQGVDASVSHILLMPVGAFAANPSQPPSATYSYRVQIH